MRLSRTGALGRLFESEERQAVRTDQSHFAPKHIDELGQVLDTGVP